jgi:serine protease Do
MKNVDLFDAYLNGTLNAEEKINFEDQLQKDSIFSSAFNEHQLVIETLKTSVAQKQLKAKLQNIHAAEFGNDAKIISLHGNNQGFFKRYGKTIAVAASTAAIVMVGSLAFLNSQKTHSNQITELKRDVEVLKYSKDAIIEEIAKTNSKLNYAPASLEGSAFALNNDGYIVTSLHMVKNADSVFIQNASTTRALTKLIFSDASLDLAVLKIEDDLVTKNWQVPFSFGSKLSEVGEKVYTLGYPRNDAVYGEGSLSSLTGFNNDTTRFQISIPINPGNSGGPLLDEQGNVVGLISGKIATAEATGFAIKANNIFKAIATFSTDDNSANISLLSKKSSLRNIKRTEQIKRISPYVFNVLVYK